MPRSSASPRHSADERPGHHSNDMTEHEHQQKKALRRRILFTSVPTVLLLAGFISYTRHGGADRILSLVTAAALLFFCCLALIRLVPQWQRAWSGEACSADPSETEKHRSHRIRICPVFHIFFAALLSRLAIFTAVYLLSVHFNGYRGGLLDQLGVWMPAGTRSADWISLAASWYPASGELTELFPFYPAAVRLFDLLFGNTLVSGLFVSSLAFSASAWLLYTLVQFDHDRGTAMTAVRWFCLLPAGLLLMLPTADSVFLMLCLCCMVLTRQKNYLAAGLFGAVAAFTRLSGLLLLLPVCIEFVADCRAREFSDKQRTGVVLKSVCGLLLIPLGTVLFAVINAGITGNALFFLQNGDYAVGYFYDAAARHTASLLSALRNQVVSSAVLHGMQLAHLVLPLLCLVAAIPRIRTSYSAYLLLYTMLTVGAQPTDIPRLTVSAFPLCILFAAAIRKRFPRFLATVILLIGLLASVYAFAMQTPIF